MNIHDIAKRSAAAVFTVRSKQRRNVKVHLREDELVAIIEFALGQFSQWVVHEQRVTDEKLHPGTYSRAELTPPADPLDGPTITVSSHCSPPPPPPQLSLSRETMVALLREVKPSNVIVWKTMSRSYTAEELIQLIQAKNEAGDDYITNLLRTSRDLISRNFKLKDVQAVSSGPICDCCNDTHTMISGDNEDGSRPVMCTYCPVPCENCRQGAGLYCKTTPCSCACHKEHPSYKRRKP